VPAPFTVVFASEAAEEVATIVAWWRTHRLAAPTLFQDELRHALIKVATFPTMGPSLRVRGGAMVRGLVLPRSGYIVLYDLDTDASLIQVLRVRHGKRRPLRRLKRR